MGMFDWLFGKQSDIDILGDIINQAAPESKDEVTTPTTDIFNIDDFSAGFLYYNSLLNEYYYIKMDNSMGLYRTFELTTLNGVVVVGRFYRGFDRIYSFYAVERKDGVDILNGLVRIDAEYIPAIYESYEDKDLFKNIILDNTNYAPYFISKSNVEGYTLSNDELLHILKFDVNNTRWGSQSKCMTLNIKTGSILSNRDEHIWFLDKFLSNTEIVSTTISENEYYEKYHYIVEFHHAVEIDEINTMYMNYIKGLLDYRDSVNVVLDRNGLSNLPEINNLDKLLLFIDTLGVYNKLVRYTDNTDIQMTSQFKLFVIEYFEKEIGK